MFLKLSFFALYICVLSQHTFVDADDHTAPGNFFRRIGDWQHAQGDAWDRKAHIWHIFDESEEPQDTPIGNLKRSFGDKTYRFADKVDGWTQHGKGIVGQVAGEFVTKRKSAGKKSAHPNPTTTFPSPQPTLTVPAGGPYFPTTGVSTSFTATAQLPSTDSTFDLRNIPFPPGYNSAPPSISIPSPPRPNPTTLTGGSYYSASSGPTISRAPPATRSIAGKLVFIDSQGKTTELTPEQVVDIGKYFDQMLKNSN
ncbi:uncharacterized protein LOC141533604 isoform X2 [Cotesia typhae]|uniref:uncharacterized protein LOC141533604 isoform X2 n=1 Tax=Cotesia typhae TaxID=2053667 RepID=UPI003D690816